MSEQKQHTKENTLNEAKELQDEELENASGGIADSFSFGVEREMKESGEKGGTTDINIGVGELQECTISKSMRPGASGPGDIKKK